MKPFRPYKPRTPGSTKSVVAQLYDEAGGVDEVAALLGISLTRTRARAEESEDAQLTFDEARRITLATGATAAAEHLAYLARGVFLPLKSSDESFSKLMSDAAVAHGALMARVVVALEDGKLTPQERQTLIGDIERGIRCLTEARTKLASQIGVA